MRIFLCLVLCFCSMFAKKHAIIVTGPESSGSTFIAKHIANVLGWEFHKFLYVNDEVLEGKNNIVVHFSQPASGKFLPLQNIKKRYNNFHLQFVLTTRDQNITSLSQKRRFIHPPSFCEKSRRFSKQILTQIMKSEKFFIWNYETMNYLGEAYFFQLYKFLEIDPKEQSLPQNLFDGNKKYIQGETHEPS